MTLCFSARGCGGSAAETGTGAGPSAANPALGAPSLASSWAVVLWKKLLAEYPGM